jgi:nitroreductase
VTHLPITAAHGAGPQPDVLKAMGTARAMRWFRSDPVPSSLIEQVLWAATRASNPNNSQGWDFVVARETGVRARIGELFAEALPTHPRRLGGAPPANQTATERRIREGAINLITTIADAPVIVFICGANVYPPGEPDITYMYSAVYAAGQNMIVAARALGLGAAFTMLHRLAEHGLRELLAIPDDRTMAVTVPMGWPARPFGPVTRRPLHEVVHQDRW